MGTAILSGSLVGSRYSIACPLCGKAGARPDCDSLGRSVIVCRCRSTPIVMPTLAPVVVSTRDGSGIVTKRETRILTDTEDRRCATEGCKRRRGPKAKRCSRCATNYASVRHPCPEPGCKKTRTHKQHRCDSCQTAFEKKRWADRYQAEKASHERDA